MIPYSNTTPQSWSEFAAWLRGLKLDDIHIEHNAERDEVIIRNSKTMTVQRISRFALEHMDPALRQETFLQTIANTMKNQQSGMVTSGVYTPGTISAGGGGGALGFGSIMRGAIGAPAYLDEFYAQQEKEESAKKLFSTKEQLMLTTIKNDLHTVYHNKRSIMENQTWNRDRMVIAGGCFASMIIGEEVKDYDVFLLYDEHNAKIMDYMETKWRDREDVRIGSSGYMNNDRIKKTMFFEQSKCQYILTDFKTREELINSFDFKHCRVSYDLMTEKLYITRETMDAIINKTLAPNTDKTPEYWRYQKFFDRGWKSEIAYI